MPSLGEYDSLDRPATLDQIKQKHLELEASPVKVFGESFDCDERSERRMKDALESWSYRPIEPGVFEHRPEAPDNRVIIWTRGDNTQVELTASQLRQIHDEMIKARAIRGAQLFARYRNFRANPETTVRDIETLENWGIVL